MRMNLPPHTLGSVLSGLVRDASEREAYSADPDAFLAERGFPDLPDRAVGEAVCQVAETLPSPVAEQLAPQVMALSPLTTVENAEWGPSTGMDALDALATVPAYELADLPADALDFDADFDIDVVDPGTVAGDAGAEDDADSATDEDPVHEDPVHEDPGFGTGESEPQAVETLDLDELSGIDPTDTLDELDDLGDADTLVFDDPVADDSDSRPMGDRSDETTEVSTTPASESDEPEIDIDWS